MSDDRLDPSDRLDPRVRELTYRLMEMAPDAPPFPEEAIAMSVPATKQRPPILVWAAAAAAVVLLIGLPLFLFRGGEEPSEPATTIAAPDTTTTTVVDEPTTTVAPSTTVDPSTTPVISPTSGDCGIDYENLAEPDPEAWYVFWGCARPGMEELLVPVALGARSDTVPDIQAAMLAQLAGPSEQLRDAGYDSFAVRDGGPDQVVEGLEGPPDLVFDFSDFRLDSGMSNASASTASMHLLAQLSSVAFQFPEVETVTFTFSGSCDSFWNWLQRDCQVIERAEWEIQELTTDIAGWIQTGSTPPPATTIPPDATGTTVLPGEPTDFWAQEGDILGVVGVAHDDVLNLRDGPGVGYEVLVGLDPLEDNLVSTGRNRFIPGAFWSEVEVDGVVGWVNQRYTGFLGLPDDITSWVVAQMGGIPEAETMLELGTMVAESFDPGEGGFRYEMVVPPTVGDLGEVTFDVVGLLDDAQLGWRLHIFGQPTAGGEGFSLMAVEGTALCGRGVTEDGLCV